MAVYVDEPIFAYRGQMYCHVWADSTEDLHAAAQAAGLKRAWFQCPPKADWEHYDCAPRIRGILIRNGAQEMDRYAALEHVARLDMASGDPELAEYGKRSLDRVSRIRARRLETPAPIEPAGRSRREM